MLPCAQVHNHNSVQHDDFSHALKGFLAVLLQSDAVDASMPLVEMVFAPHLTASAS
jgi:hypothetical protein